MEAEKVDNKELLPCPFTGEKPDFIIYPVECESYEGRITVESIELEIYFTCRDKEVIKERLLNIWNTRIADKDNFYIHHPVTGERMNKAMCKHVITQMYEEIKKYRELLIEVLGNMNIGGL